MYGYLTNNNVRYKGERVRRPTSYIRMYTRRYDIAKGVGIRVRMCVMKLKGFRHAALLRRVVQHQTSRNCRCGFRPASNLTADIRARATVSNSTSVFEIRYGPRFKTLTGLCG